MKKRIIPSLLSVVLLIAGMFFLLNSCQKQSNSTNSGQNQDLIRARADLKAFIAKNGTKYTVPLNEKVNAFYSDKNGKPVPADKLQRHGGNGVTVTSITSACDFSNAPVATLNSYSIFLQCDAGFQVSWNYTVSTNNNIVATNSHTSTVTAGKFSLYNSSNTLIYSATNCSPTSITDIGADPFNSGYELYSVTFSTVFLPISDFSTSYTTKLGALLVTNCPDVEAFPIALQSYSATNYQFPSNQPCTRIDPSYANNSSFPLRIWGEDALGLCSGTGFVYPDLQEINFSIDGGGWFGGNTNNGILSFYLTTAVSPYTNIVNSDLGYVDPYSLLILQLGTPTGISSGAHIVSVRQRNITFNNPASFYPGGNFPSPSPGVNCCVGPWSASHDYSITYP